MEQPVPVKEVKILETAEDIQERREQVSLQLILLNLERCRRLEDKRDKTYVRKVVGSNLNKNLTLFKQPGSNHHFKLSAVCPSKTDFVF